MYPPALSRGSVIAMPPAPRWFRCARARLSLPKRVSWTGSRLPHMRFAQRRWRSVFRKSSSTQLGASLITATSSRRADSCHGSIYACFSLTGFLGPGVRAETARFALDDPAADEARYFTGFAPPQTHGDRAVLKAQEWVHTRDGTGVALAALARASGLGRRTLLRRFASATGMTPIEYCRRVRIARARELLEGGDTSQKEIAKSLGYKDVASFARAFRKAVGSAPGAYRKRFGGKGISPADFAAKDSSRQDKHLFAAGAHRG